MVNNIECVLGLPLYGEFQCTMKYRKNYVVTLPHVLARKIMMS